MTVETCGNCRFCHAHPLGTTDEPAGQCYGEPPRNMALPSQAIAKEPENRIALPKDGQKPLIGITITSLRPSVNLSDPACCLWQAKH